MEQFTEIIQVSTERVGGEYFQLPIAGSENPIYRERVYCYELYHQMRRLWPQGSHYSLSGEIDKNGHPLIHGNSLDRIKPDFLVHVPGVMNNYGVIEVKPINGSLRGIKKDLKTLNAFCQHAGYQRAIYLFYGNGNSNNIMQNLKAIAHAPNSGIDLTAIEVWHHRVAGDSAVLISD
jgi:hypothetical protein